MEAFIQTVETYFMQEQRELLKFMERNAFRVDTVNFLRFLGEGNATLTARGNLNLKTLEKISTFIKYPWYVSEKFPIRNESEWRYLEKIDVYTQMLKLAANRRSSRMLTRKGREFLAASAIYQLLSLFFLYFDRVNWCYLFPFKERDEDNPAYRLQEKRWFMIGALLAAQKNKEEWVDFNAFSEFLRKKLDLKMINYLGEDLPERVDDCIDDVLVSQFRLFDLVEYKVESELRSDPRLRLQKEQLFRLSSLGEALLKHLLSPNTQPFSLSFVPFSLS